MALSLLGSDIAALKNQGGEGNSRIVDCSDLFQKQEVLVSSLHAASLRKIFLGLSLPGLVIAVLKN